MSKIIAEQLLAGIILGDQDNEEYIYMSGGELASEHPICIFEKHTNREDLPLEQAVRMASRLNLKPTAHPLYGKRAY